MRRREFFHQGLAAAVLPAFGGTPRVTRKPNILFLLADSWRGQTLPTADAPDLKAPNLAKLATEGVRLPRAYVADPTCSPSRAAILTGRFAHRSGVTRNNMPLPAGEKTLATQLWEAGYRTGYIGKWNLDGAGDPGFVPPGKRRHGFEYWAAFNRGHRYYDPIYFRDTPDPIRPEGFEPDYQTGLAIDFIRNNREQPFFLLVSWGPPHPPRKPPNRFAALYRDVQLRIRYNVPAEDTEEAQRNYAGYYGLCSALDWNTGRLLRVLEETGLVNNTIVVFTSDHGDMLGSHGLQGNEAPYEEAVRVPLVMRYPLLIRGERELDVPVSNVDLMPTLLSLAGVAVPKTVQGRNLASLLTGQGGPRPEAVYCQGKLGSPGEWRMVVRGLDKVVVDREFQITHLYNLGQDPFETQNLATEKRYRRKRDEMFAILESWMRRTSDRILPSGLRLRG